MIRFIDFDKAMDNVAEGDMVPREVVRDGGEVWAQFQEVQAIGGLMFTARIPQLAYENADGMAVHFETEAM